MEAVTLYQRCEGRCEGQGKAKDGEKSDVGIVVRTLAGKAAKASESAHKKKSSMQAPTQKAETCAKPETVKEKC